jgi:hypothetical protein
MPSHAHHARHASPRRRHPVMVGAAAGSAVTAIAGGALAGSVPAAAPVSLTAFPAAAQAPSAIPAAAHPQLASAVTTQYAVQPGDTLSAIAQDHGFGSDWKALWAANFGAVPDPDVIVPGMRLSLAWGQLTPGMKAELARLAAPRPSSPPPAQAPAPAPAQSSAPSGGTAVAAASGPVQVSGSAFQDCVIRAESGGNPEAQNPSSTASGLYGFLDTTWEAVTGMPGPARDYSVAEQTAAFSKLYAEDGTAPWGPYDGC